MSDGGYKRAEPYAGGVLQPPVDIERRKQKRSVKLRVLQPKPVRWKLSDIVPETRGDCPTTRPCPHIKCEWNTWMIDGRDRPGRRGEAVFDEQGVLRRDGVGKRRRLDLPASDVNVHSVHNCARDVLDHAATHGTHVPMAVIAEVYGISERAAYLILARAKRKLANATMYRLLEQWTKR